MFFSTLNHPIRWVFLAHILAGVISLGTFAIPLAAQKGRKLHIRAGWIYIGAMLWIGLSTLILTLWRIFYDPNRSSSSVSFAFFLIYVALFSLASISYGVCALKSKKRNFRSFSVLHIGPPLVILLMGLAIQAIGIYFQNTLLILFPLLGHLTSIGQARYWLQAPSTKMHWWYAHMNGMFIACIATITNFLVTTLPKIWPNSFTQSFVLWITPGLILGILLNRWEAFYRKKFE